MKQREKLNKIKKFYKPNVFKISFLIGVSVFMISFLLIGFGCGTLPLEKVEHKCGPFLDFPVSIAFGYFFFIVMFLTKFIPENIPVTIILVFAIHTIIVYTLACLLDILWRKIKK